jgi:hypothetical protein
MADTKTHFQDGLQFVWDSTSLGLLKTCPEKYNLTMRQDYVSKGKSIHLEYGLLAHSARELYYKDRTKNNTDHETALKNTIKWAAIEAKNLPEHKTKTPYSLLLFLETYLDHYQDDPCETVLLPDGSPAVEYSFKLDVGDYMLAGHIDRVVNLNGKLYISDLKSTTSTLNDEYFAQYSPNNQMSLYDFAASCIFPERAAGIILDAFQVLAGGIRLERRIIHRTDAQREEWFRDFQQWMIINKHYTKTNHYPMNDTACNNYGKCPFRDYHCSLVPALRKQSLNAYFDKRIWNPLDNR